MHYVLSTCVVARKLSGIGVEGPTMGGGWPRTCPFLRLGKIVGARRAGPATGGGVQGVEKAFDTGQSGGGLLGSIAVVQHPPSAFHPAQNLHGGGFPVEWLGLLIAPL